MKKYILLIIFILLVYTTTFASDFTDNGNGTISDNTTGFMWQKQDDATLRAWTDAITYCEGLSLASYTDWRLPNVKELKSIADMSKYSPAINTAYFPNTQSLSYWSSTTDASNTLYAWVVEFGGGMPNTSYKPTDLGYVRCVR